MSWQKIDFTKLWLSIWLNCCSTKSTSTSSGFISGSSTWSRCYDFDGPSMLCIKIIKLLIMNYKDYQIMNYKLLK